MEDKRRITQMQNSEIYAIANALSEAFNDSDLYIPAKINFFIQKNRSYFNKLKEDIEKIRAEIITRYGEYVAEEDKYIFSAENTSIANKELTDLFNIAQSVEYFLISLSSLESLSFTSKQMQAILFMIEEG